VLSLNVLRARSKSYGGHEIGERSSTCVGMFAIAHSMLKTWKHRTIPFMGAQLLGLWSHTVIGGIGMRVLGWYSAEMNWSLEFRDSGVV
jgi:hypothetical protein